MILSPTELGPEHDCTGEGQQRLETTDRSSRQRGRITSTNPQPSDSNKNLVLGPTWDLDTKTDWPTDLCL
jgi:hypothetical protein